eukprot:5674164-Prymnesium_polylepis.1
MCKNVGFCTNYSRNEPLPGSYRAPPHLNRWEHLITENHHEVREPDVHPTVTMIFVVSGAL